MDGGCTVWLCWTPPNYTLKRGESGKFHVMYVLPQWKTLPINQPTAYLFNKSILLTYLLCNVFLILPHDFQKNLKLHQKQHTQRSLCFRPWTQQRRVLLSRRWAGRARAGRHPPRPPSLGLTRPRRPPDLLHSVPSRSSCRGFMFLGSPPWHPARHVLIYCQSPATNTQPPGLLPTKAPMHTAGAQ